MSSGANVNSIEAVRDFRAALHTFDQEAHEALVSFDTEVRRSIEWLLQGAPAAWENERNKAERAMSQAKIDLARCRAMPLADGRPPACLEERKQLERARQRLAYAEEKIKIVLRLGQAADREATEYKGRANQLVSLLDGELPRAVALLDRVLSILESYVGLNQPTGGLSPEERAGAEQIASAAQGTPAEPSASTQPEAQEPVSETRAAAEGASDGPAVHTKGSASSGLAGGET